MATLFQYMSTVMELVSTQDLRSISEALEESGLTRMHLFHDENTGWFACYEPAIAFETPEATIDAILSAMERFPADLQIAWSGCSQRQLDVSFTCGVEPWAYNQSLSPALLSRIAALGLTLKITLYPAAA